MNYPATGTNQEHGQLFTTTEFFHNFEYSPGEKYLMQVLPGVPILEALNSSSILMDSIISTLGHLLERSKDASGLYAVQFMAEATKALLSSTLHEIEFGNHQVGGVE